MGGIEHITNWENKFKLYILINKSIANWWIFTIYNDSWYYNDLNLFFFKTTIKILTSFPLVSYSWIYIVKLLIIFLNAYFVFSCFTAISPRQNWNGSLSLVSVILKMPSEGEIRHQFSSYFYSPADEIWQGKNLTGLPKGIKVLWGKTGIV